MWEQTAGFMQEQLNNNELFKGGLLLMIGGALMAILRSWPSRLWALTKRQSMVVIDIPDKDPAFDWVNQWLASHNYGKNRARLLTVKTTKGDRDHGTPDIIFSPAPGTHWLWFKRRLMILNRTRQTQAEGGATSGGANVDPFREFFTLRVLGRDRKVPMSLIEEAYALANPDTSNKFSVYRANQYGSWYTKAWVPKRTADSVILPHGVSENLISDLSTFLESEDWYVDRGIPYRRGYLFSGPPGSGKTSAVTAMANYFNMDIALLNLRSGLVDDYGLCELLSDVPKQAIVLLEDVDCVVSGRNVEAESITFSGLLNAIDGVGAKHGQVIFMTTNHADRLDSALIRPGRCDIQVGFHNADYYQKAQMFDRFFPGTGLSDEFASRITNPVSMAEVQKHMMEYRHSADEALTQSVTMGRTLNEQTKTEACAGSAT